MLGLVLESGVRLAKCWSTAPSRNCTSRSGLEMQGSQTSPHRLDSGRLRRAGRFGPRPADLANFASTLIPRKRVKAGGSRERPNGFAALWPGVNASPPLVADSNRECTPIDPPPRTTTRQAANWSIFKLTFIAVGSSSLMAIRPRCYLLGGNSQNIQLFVFDRLVVSTFITGLSP